MITGQSQWELFIRLYSENRSGTVCPLYIDCNCHINYGRSGKTTLARHVSNSNKKHQNNKKAHITNTIIPNSWHDPTVQAEKFKRCEPREVECSLPYRAAPSICSISTCKIFGGTEKTTDFSCCWSNTRDGSMHIVVFWENSIPMVPNLIKFPQNLSKDRPVLQGVTKDHTAATYKLCEGLSVYKQTAWINREIE